MTPPPDTTTQGPDPYGRILSNTRDLLPTLEGRTTETERLRKLPKETVADLKAANLFSCFTPKYYGGFELDWAYLSDITKTLGTACGSSSWIVTASAAHNILLGRFPKEAQDDVYGKGSEIIVAMALAGHGEIKKDGDGYRINGRWKFASGIDHADWVVVGVKTDDTGPNGLPQFLWVLVDPQQIEIYDTWRSIGLRGTGSNDVEAKNVEIPAHYILASDECDRANPPGSELHDGYIYKVQYFQYFRSCLIGPILGVTTGALQAYVEQTRKRTGKVTGEGITSQIPVQVKLSESAAELRAAELIAKHIKDTLVDFGQRSILVLPGANRVALNRDLTYMARLCVQSVQRLTGMMGASGLDEANPVQRHFGDLRAMAAHGGLQWERYMAPYGQWVFGEQSGDPEIDRAMGEPAMEDFFLAPLP